MTYRIGIDIGGTFTDVVFLADDGTTLTAKLSSTPDDYSLAIADGVGQIMQLHGIDGGEVSEVLHGTTIATNAILQHRGVKTALITTEGFADVLEIRRLRMLVLYDLAWRKPESLVARANRYEIAERMDHRGVAAKPLDEAQAAHVIDRLLAKGDIEAIAVCLLNSYANGAHEDRILELIRERDANIPVCLSSQVLPEIKEYERTSTTVVNAYILPVVKGYLDALSDRLRALKIAAPIMVMQSNGGAMGVAAASTLPIHIIESGPAAGVVGAAEVIKQLGHDNALTFDMGGTTAKAAMIENGGYNRVGELDVGAGINLAGRLLKGGGYHVRVPAIDIAEIGAGGGSLLALDGVGGISVGPESAGADPGPVCYGLGNDIPTVTDANVLLGYLNPRHLVGGGLSLDKEKAAAALREKMAAPLGMSIEAVAHGAHTVADATMARALRAVSSDRGRDPRDFALIAFGGNGPVHAASLCDSLEIKRILIPPVGGVFSALGLLFPATEHHYVQTFRRSVESCDLGELEAAFKAKEADGQAALAAEGYGPENVRCQRFVDLRYRGENSELSVAYPDCSDLLAALRQAFDDAHEKTYGYHSAEESVEIVNLRLVATGVSESGRVPKQLSLADQHSVGSGPGEREAYFGPDAGWLATPVLGRGDIDGNGRAGPLIVEEYDCTTVVPPGWRIHREDWDVLVLTTNQD
ncbi:MAG: hydantoinase/oxoprolinase family protein [Alphaproteobacteria bacterium]|jgi:N-methylhydantoinase A|nr:hydantoinase/oxoprolinase family protein [Alphaproteobacteria bacterium]